MARRDAWGVVMTGSCEELASLHRDKVLMRRGEESVTRYKFRRP